MIRTCPPPEKEGVKITKRLLIQHPYLCNRVVFRVDYLRVSSLLVFSFDVFHSPGVLQADSGVIRDHGQISRLFYHETMRVFHDRLINHEDKSYFNTILAEMAQKHFSQVQIS